MISIVPIFTKITTGEGEDEIGATQKIQNVEIQMKKEEKIRNKYQIYMYVLFSGRVCYNKKWL